MLGLTTAGLAAKLLLLFFIDSIYRDIHAYIIQNKLSVFLRSITNSKKGNFLYNEKKKKHCYTLRLIATSQKRPRPPLDQERPRGPPRPLAGPLLLLKAPLGVTVPLESSWSHLGRFWGRSGAGGGCGPVEVEVGMRRALRLTTTVA
jgi:hypothetical protein